MTTLYTLTTQRYIKHLSNMEAILAKAAIKKETLKITDDALCNARLTLDQFPLAKQIQLMSDYSKKSGAILAGSENPVYADDEKTLDELVERLRKTRTFLESLPKEEVSNLKDVQVPLVWMPGKGLTGEYYVETFGHENFYFHYATAYSILRHYGLDIGKADFMGGLDFIDVK